MLRVIIYNCELHDIYKLYIYVYTNMSRILHYMMNQTCTGDLKIQPSQMWGITITWCKLI